MRRVVITGMGIVSSIGNDLSEVLNGLREGKSGIEYIAEREKLGFRSPLGGTLKNLDKPPLKKKNLRQMGEGGFLAAHATLEALGLSRLPDELVGHERTGVIIGNHGNMHDIYTQCAMVAQEGKKLPGTAAQRVMGSSVSANLSVWLGTRGYTLTVSSACSSGSTAVGYAFQLIRAGLQDRAICGAVQEGNWESVCHFDAARAFSTRVEEPRRASRPFDVGRDGLVPSCGAGIVVLEEYEQARERGAEIIAEVLGYAMTSDGYDMTEPSGDGAVRCMQGALADAGLTAADVDYVNAHATSTPVGDAVEARAIGEVVGSSVYVSSTKSMTGHELAAAGSNELVYTLLMMKHGFIAPTINLDELDAACGDIQIVANEPVHATVRTAMSNSFAYGGVNTSLIVRRS